MKTARIIIGTLWLTAVVLPFYPGQADECTMVCCCEMVEVCDVAADSDCPTLQAQNGINPQPLSLAGTATISLPAVREAPGEAPYGSAEQVDPVFMQQHLPLLLPPPGVNLLV